MAATLTAEQKSIVRKTVQPGEILKIIAFAGTGKTTTLASYALNRPNQHFLYIAFNKSMQLDAQQKFPSNVTCRTVHALAFPRFGSNYQHKLNNPRVHQVSDALGIATYYDAKAVLDTATNYIISADRELSKQHLPGDRRDSSSAGSTIDQAALLWQLMQDTDDSRIPMPHDGYLKLFQLSDPQLNYDALLLDEAQDTNPVTAALVQQQNCARILVGDPYQQIYGFRGAVDAMQHVESDNISYLTNSFRFNQHIADVANLILQAFKDESHVIRGVGNHGSLQSVNIPYTMIARTNAGLFDEAVSHYRRHSIAILGLRDKPFRQIEDAYYLHEDNHQYIRDPFLKKFDSYEVMKEYAKSVDDFELLSLCKVIDNYEGVDIPSMLDRIREKTVNDPSKADVILTTTHKAKGLEFDHVKLADDFVPLIDNDEPKDVEKVDSEEINLIYVALTRTKKQLEINPNLRDFLEWNEFEVAATS